MQVPDTCRAVVVSRFNEPPRVAEVPVPKELEPGALLVRTQSASTCGTDEHLWRGELALDVKLPVILGHEMVGRIVAFGSGQRCDSFGTPLVIGDRIVWSHASCKACRLCTDGFEALCRAKRSYMYETCTQYPYLLGGFSEYIYVLPNSGRVRVPDPVTSDVASITSCAFRSVINAFEQIPPIRPTDAVVIQGAGPLGIFSACLACLAGAREVVVVGDPVARLEFAERFGATSTLSLSATSAESRISEIKAMTDGLGADLCVEVTGSPGAFPEGLEMLRPGGTYLTVGNLGAETIPFVPGLVTRNNLRIIGSVSATISHYRRALEIVASQAHRFPFAELITGRYAIENIVAALAGVREGRHLKAVFEFDDVSLQK